MKKNIILSLVFFMIQGYLLGMKSNSSSGDSIQECPLVVAARMLDLEKIKELLKGTAKTFDLSTAMYVAIKELPGIGRCGKFEEDKMRRGMKVVAKLFYCDSNAFKQNAYTYFVSYDEKTEKKVLRKKKQRTPFELLTIRYKRIEKSPKVPEGERKKLRSSNYQLTKKEKRASERYRNISSLWKKLEVLSSVDSRRKTFG